MPKLKPTDDELDVASLEEAEWSEGEFEEYDGEIPPKGTVLTGYVKSLWWTYTQNEDPMIKLLWIAAENEEELADYNGLPIWENMALIPGAKFRWAPFFAHFGLTLRDIKAKTTIAAEDDERFGAPILKIANWEPGEESDAAWCRILTKRERYDGEWRAGVGKWMELEEGEVVEEEEEEENDTEEQEDEETAEEETDEEEEEEEEPPARPTRSRRTSAAAKPAAKAPSKPATKPTTRTARTTTTATRGAKPTATKAPAKPTTRRGAKPKAGYSDDPPF